MMLAQQLSPTRHHHHNPRPFQHTRARKPKKPNKPCATINSIGRSVIARFRPWSEHTFEAAWPRGRPVAE
jgi:hypothetical protein